MQKEVRTTLIIVAILSCIGLSMIAFAKQSISKEAHPKSSIPTLIP